MCSHVSWCQRRQPGNLEVECTCDPTAWVAGARPASWPTLSEILDPAPRRAVRVQKMASFRGFRVLYGDSTWDDFDLMGLPMDEGGS